MNRVHTVLWVPLVLGLAGGFDLAAQAAGPESAGWYSGDMHVHRSCGTAPVSVSSIYNAMTNRGLAVISLLADTGNGEVQNPVTDLPLVNGQDDPVSTAGHIVHWDAEWHWDADYSQYAHQALGGHLVTLGLTNAHQIWFEYTYPVFQWTHQQGGIAGFAHLQYLDDGFPQTLTCCTPIEYPVEVALGACDYISEDVAGGDSAIHAYYRLLNCGFRPGFAGGSDYPCGAAIGDVISYVQVAGGLTYRKWITGIASGRTVVSRNAHNEFLDFKVNGTASPGDEIQLTNSGTVSVSVQWTAAQSLSGTMELVQNGVVVASQAASAAPGSPATLNATVGFTNSGWLCARRMGSIGHEVHTAAVFVTVAHAPVRASVADAQFYVQWMDNLLQMTSTGGVWGYFFTTNRVQAQARYSAARTLYQQIALDAAQLLPLSLDTDGLPYGSLNAAYSAVLTGSGGIAPYTWSIIAGALPPGLKLDSATGAITGTATNIGTFNFTAKVSDASNPIKTAINSLSITIAPVANLISIWPSSAVPVVVDTGTDAPVELGVKFRSDIAGTITGIRFYKAAANTGTHVGDLWTTNGSLLATATFTGESASGWQQVNLTTPVTIAPNTVYVASYHANTGDYSEDDDYFSGSGVDNPPLHALADGVAGSNGVYAYGASSVFPTNAFSAANYWVDVVLATNTAPVLPAQNNKTIGVLTTLTVTNTAIDTDFPANNLSYLLLAAPSGASIDTNGIITWTPLSAQGNSTNLFTTRVTDNGPPPLSATNSFTVFVNPAPVIPPPVIQSINLSNGMVIVKWCCVSNCTYRLQYNENLAQTNWTDVAPDICAAGVTATATNAAANSTQRFYRILVVPLP